jgi:hypothetical protein
VAAVKTPEAYADAAMRLAMIHDAYLTMLVRDVLRHAFRAALSTCPDHQLTGLEAWARSYAGRHP